MDLIRTWKTKLLNALTIASAVLTFVVGLVPDLTAWLSSLLPFLPEGEMPYLIVGFVLAFLSRLPRILPELEKLRAKLVGSGPAALFFLAAINLGTPGCAWLQTTRGQQIQCAAIATVQGAPELVAIVAGCATIAADVSAVIPCIRGAAGSHWAADIVACFSAHAAGLSRCPAAEHGLASGYLGPKAAVKLRAATLAEWGEFSPAP